MKSWVNEKRAGARNGHAAAKTDSALSGIDIFGAVEQRQCKSAHRHSCSAGKYFKVVIDIWRRMSHEQVASQEIDPRGGRSMS